MVKLLLLFVAEAEEGKILRDDDGCVTVCNTGEGAMVTTPGPSVAGSITGRGKQHSFPILFMYSVRFFFCSEMPHLWLDFLFLFLRFFEQFECFIFSFFISSVLTPHTLFLFSFFGMNTQNYSLLSQIN